MALFSYCVCVVLFKVFYLFCMVLLCLMSTCFFTFVYLIYIFYAFVMVLLYLFMTMCPHAKSVFATYASFQIQHF